MRIIRFIDPYLELCSLINGVIFRFREILQRNDWFRVDATAEEFEGVGDPSKIELILKYLNSWLVTEAKAGIPR